VIHVHGKRLGDAGPEWFHNVQGVIMFKEFFTCVFGLSLIGGGTSLAYGQGEPAEKRDEPGVALPPPPASREPGKVKGIPARDPKASSKLIDLSNYYTLALTEDAAGQRGNHTLASLPAGVQKLGDVQYDLRGIVQVSGRLMGMLNRGFPAEVKGIKVGTKCQKLYFLHATHWSVRDGTKIGAYVIHYSNGQTQEVPIVYGPDVRDWTPRFDSQHEVEGAVVAWKGKNDADLEILLYATAWTNPHADLEIESVDFVSSMTTAAPFLVAMTAE
jgi:hypothetical protein